MADNEEGRKHDPKPQGHVSTHVYLQPESYNQLVKELEQNWPHLWESPIQYYIWANAPQFVATMNEALDLCIRFDSANVDGICKHILDELRVKRGVSRLHQLSEYNHDWKAEADIRATRASNEVAPWLNKQ